MGISLGNRGACAEIALNRPPANAANIETVGEIISAVSDLDPTQPVILTGTGGIFSAGVDTKAFAAYAPAEKAEMVRAITRMTAHLLNHAGPVVAAVDGHALGGGFVLALCGDYRLAAQRETAKYGLTEAQAGIPFPAGPAEIIRHELPPPILRRLTLTSQVIGIHAMREAGLFDRIVANEDLLTLAAETAEAMAGQPGFAMVKRQVRGALADRLSALAASGADPLADHLLEG